MLRSNSKPVIYSFPELKTQDVLECLTDLGIALNESELSKPSSPIVQRVYEAFIDMFMGIPRETFLEPLNAYGVMEMLEYPELHAESISLVGFYRTLSKLMMRVGIDDFSLRDLIRPEGPRFRIVLSAVINFAKFREEQLSVFEEFNHKSEELVESQSRLASRQQDLVLKIDAIRQKREEEEPHVSKLRQDIAGLIQELRELKREQTSLSSEIEQLKSKRSELSEKLAHIQFLLSSIRQECNKLKSRIVHSPEKLLQIISEMSANITTEKTNLAQLERKSRELQIKLEALGTLEIDLYKSQQLLESTEVALKKKQELIRQVQEEQELADRQQTTFNDLLIREQQLQRQFNAAQDKISRLQTQQEQRRQTLGSRLKTLQQEYTVVADERSRVSIEIDQAEKTIKDLEARMGELVRSHESEMFNLRTDCLGLKSQVVQYSGEVKKHLNGNGGEANQ